jgi:tRNA (guanine37-N1)-methyltransferase
LGYVFLVSGGLALLVPCVKVYKVDVERAVSILSRAGVLDGRFKFGRLGDFVCIPVRDVGVASGFLSGIVGFEVLELELEPRPVKPRGLSGVFEGLASYSLVGDIVVFNWRSEVPDVDVYREAALHLMSEQARIKAAFLKRDTFGEFRVQRLIHLAGENRTRTIHREYGLSFHVDIARVYFNPRLASEHRRVAEEALDGDIVLDMFSGVGGFSVHVASLRKSRVVAVDVNPAATALAALNVAENRGKLKGKITVLRADAALLPLVLKPVFTRIIMNHPTASKYYLGEACRLAERHAIIYYYTRTINCKEAEIEVLERKGPCCRELEVVKCRSVLEYSPSHAIYNVTLKISKSPGT